MTMRFSSFLKEHGLKPVDFWEKHKDLFKRRSVYNWANDAWAARSIPCKQTIKKLHTVTQGKVDQSSFLFEETTKPQ